MSRLHPGFCREGGALVRRDQRVAWRGASAPGSPGERLASVLQELLGLPPRREETRG